MTESHQSDPVVISQGLVKVRKCRWLLWCSLIVYIPGLYLALQLDLPRPAMTWLFGAWVALICVTVGVACVVRCPQCNKPFHTNGPTFLPVRSCVHCGLHVKADKTAAKPKNPE